MGTEMKDESVPVFMRLSALKLAYTDASFISRLGLTEMEVAVPPARPYATVPHLPDVLADKVWQERLELLRRSRFFTSGRGSPWTGSSASPRAG